MRHAPRDCRALTVSGRIANPRCSRFRDVVDSDLPIVGLAVFKAASLAGKDLERLVAGSYRGVQLFCHVAGGEPVLLAPCDQRRARDFLGHSGQRELLHLLHRRVHVLRAEHPRQLEMRGGDAVVVLLHRRPALLPHRVVVVVRAPGDAGGVALLECGDTRRVVAAGAVGHDRHPLWVHVLAHRDELVRRCAGGLVVVAGRVVAQPQRLALTGAVDRQRVEAAERELDAGEQDIHLLAVVEAVEQHDGGRAALRARRFEEVRGERGIFVGDVHDLEIGIAALEPFLRAPQALAVDRKLPLARGHHALARVVVGPGAQVVVSRGRVAPLRRRGIGRFLHLFGHGAPLFLPGVRLAGPLVQALDDFVDFAQRDRAPRRHSLRDRRGVRPLVVLRKAVDPVAFVKHFVSPPKKPMHSPIHYMGLSQ